MRARSGSDGRVGTVAAALSLLLALVVSVLVLTAKVGTEISRSATGVTTTRHVSLLETEGVGVAFVLAVPVVIAGVAVALAGRGRGVRRVAWSVAAGLLWAWVVVVSMSVGLFYAPSAFAMTIAWLGARPARRPRLSHSTA